MRKALLGLLRLYAYLFHVVLCLFLLGLRIVGAGNLKLGMLPWEGAALTQALLWMSLAGILCCLLAMTGMLRWLFPLWALFVFVMMFRGFFVSSYSFADEGQFKFGVGVTVGALVALVGSLWVRRPRMNTDKRG